jgi:quinol monooxygenase YgiN
MSITLFATLSIKPGQLQAAKNELAKMLAPSRAEPGCQRYEIYQAEQVENSLHLIETYADHDAMEAHSKSLYFKNMVENIGPLLEKEFAIQTLFRLD